MTAMTLSSPLLLMRFLALWASSNTCRQHAEAFQQCSPDDLLNEHRAGTSEHLHKHGK